jgi:hypothetical protein
MTSGSAIQLQHSGERMPITVRADLFYEAVQPCELLAGHRRCF